MIRARNGVADTQPAFEQLSDRLDLSLVEEWTRQERVAMEERGDALHIYDVKSNKGGEFYFRLIAVLLMDSSTYTGGNTPEVIGNGGAAGEPVRFRVRTNGGCRN